MINLIVITAFLASTVLAQGEYPYLGCFLREQVLQGQSGIVLGHGDPMCNNYCYDHGSLYAYSYIENFRGSLTTSCLCTDMNPDYQYRGGNCTVDTDTITDVFVEALTDSNGYWSNFCYQSPYTDSGVQYTDIYQCFTRCALLRYAVITFREGDSTANCNCFDFNENWINHPISPDCNPGDWVVFELGPQPSAFVKRQREKQHRLEVGQQEKKCPKDLTACKTSKSDLNSFECIDTKHELESCGGCIHGEFGSSHGKIGVDCTILPGVTAKGVACSESKCVSFECEEGYKLVNERCTLFSG